MSVTLAAIAKHQGKNPPGYRKVWVAPIEDVETVPAATDGDVASALTMVSTKTFFELPIDEEGGAFLSTETPEAEGTTGSNWTFTAFVAGGITGSQVNALDLLDGVYLAIIGERKDGVKELIFEQGRGIRLRLNRESAAKPGTRQGVMLQGSNDFNRIAPYTYSDGTVAT